jgi:diguanylate cyclase (GGDEF)-like protein
MISLKKYLDSVESARSELGVFESGDEDVLSAAIAAYASALAVMGHCSVAACPGLGQELKRHLEELSTSLSTEMSCAELAAMDAEVQEELQTWGRRTAGHYRLKASEVKDLLMTLARTAEAVGAHDLRCAGGLHAVTSQLHEIASLDDLTRMRASIKKSAAELKSSMERMAAEGKAIVDELRKEVVHCRAKLEEAEEIASRDALTGLRSRLNVEDQIEARVAAKTPFCVGMVDIDDFKKINDEYGHVVGDELLKQFAGELRSICRSTDVIGRWGGDEFIILLDCSLSEATAQRDRLRNWVCGSYTVQGSSGATKLSLNISIGLAEYQPGEPVKELLTRADDAMYEHKGIARKTGGLSAR